MRGFGALLVMVALAAVIHLGFPVVLVADDMMAPGLRSSGWMFMFGLGVEAAPGRLVGFEHKGNRVVRRVVAGPGAKVSFKRGALHIDGLPAPLKDDPSGDVRFTVQRLDKSGGELHKAKAKRETVAGVTYTIWVSAKAGTTRKAVKVPAGHVFVACDNRSYCRDSRHWGTIPIESIWAAR